jgi:hypothetical protein
MLRGFGMHPDGKPATIEKGNPDIVLLEWF